MSKAPNEKLIETLFIYYALRYLEGEGVTVYTPSSREEAAKGYDAGLMGASEFDELFLQFKTPSLLAFDWTGRRGYSIRTTEHQHKRLKLYPPYSAFYVTHTFSDVTQIQAAQRDARSAGEFLRRYTAIAIGHLEVDVRRFRYYATTPGRLPEDVKYKREVDGGERNPRHPIAPGRGWLDGEEILRGFKARTLGARVCLVGPGEDQAGYDRLAEGPDLPPFEMNRDRAEQMLRHDEGPDYGTAIRRQVTPFPWQPAE